MNKSKFLVVLLALFAPVFVSISSADMREQIDRWEVGVSAGVGFYVGQEDPTGDGKFSRVMTYDVLGFAGKDDWGWPGIETFGFFAGYRFDAHWHVKLQTTRQRVCFAEYPQGSDLKNVYYNAMWHLDAMAEYNILALGNVMMPKQGLYSVVPYVGFGLGMTMFNKEATFRAYQKRNSQGGSEYHKSGTMFPRVGSLPASYKANGMVDTWQKTEVGVGAYLPVACGIKWRANDNVQVKATFQYNLYLSPNSNLEGGSSDPIFGSTRPSFDDIKKKFGRNHDCLFSLSAVFNLGKWYEDRLITY